MSGGGLRVALSEIDEERFGVRTARATEVSAEDLPALVDYCLNNRVRFLIARCPVAEVRAAQLMERHGFSLMDTLIYYQRDLTRAPVPSDEAIIHVRAMRPGEEEVVKAVALDAFRGYSGHYHADERLEREKCDEAYASWASRSCVSKSIAHEVLVMEANETIVAFATLRRNSDEEGEGVLFGVSASTQGKGIYRLLMIGGMNWCLAQGARRMIVSTQITNLAVQRVWTRLGFEPTRAYYTFHKWFD